MPKSCCLTCAGIKRTGAPKLIAFRVIGADYHSETGKLTHLHTLSKAMEHRSLPADAPRRAVDTTALAAKTTPQDLPGKQAETKPTEMQEHAMENLEKFVGPDYLVSFIDSSTWWPTQYGGVERDSTWHRVMGSPCKEGRTNALDTFCP